MDKNRKTAIAIAIAAVVLLGVLYFLAQGNKRYLWSETYNDDGIQPYDLSLFKGVLEKSANEFEVLEGLFVDTNYLEGTGNSMVYVAGYAWIDSTEAALLKQFVEQGNNLLISSRVAGKTLRYLIDCDVEEEETLSESKESESIKVEDDGQSFVLSFDQYNQPSLHTWIHFKDLTCVETAGFIEIDSEKHPNLVMKQMGKGMLYLHSTPLVFTNYHFRNDSAFNYVNGLIAKANGETYYYLEPGFSQSPSGGPNIGESPIKFILAHQSLKWAWYVTILLGLLYILNSMRRKQRAIPVAALPENQTTAYLDMVYQLFRKEGSHRDIVQSQVKLLQSFLRNRYNLNAHKLNDDFYEMASAKLKLDKNYIEQFFKQLERSRYNSTLNDSELLTIDREITEFYLRCP
ncbi:hypothetical protein O3Q51_07140 [Cryomorphaceae bacterium 1068]|nr:hypothetical protein [Cryomorphaceae bacterium 1068]